MRMGEAGSLALSRELEGRNQPRGEVGGQAVAARAEKAGSPAPGAPWSTAPRTACAARAAAAATAFRSVWRRSGLSRRAAANPASRPTPSPRG